MKAWLTVMFMGSLALACSNEVEGDSGTGGAGGGGGAAGVSGSGGGATLPGDELVVDVPATGRRLVDLDGPSVMDDGAADSLDWELALGGWDVFTNGGLSGPGQGAGFGPLDASEFAHPRTVQDVPFLPLDTTGGAFHGWNFYDQAGGHVLWSRMHIVAVRSQDHDYKVQILSYYGERDGAPIPGLYRVRWAALGGATQELSVDGTAGGPTGAADAPSGCLVLATGEVKMLAPADVAARTDWDLCFRRDQVGVNGELGGPGSVVAADLDEARRASETLDAVRKLTPAGELARFEAIDQAAVDAVRGRMRGDRIVNMFSDVWFELASEPRRPAPGTWLIADAAGARRFLLMFSDIQRSTPESAGQVTLRVRSWP